MMPELIRRGGWKAQAAIGKEEIPARLAALRPPGPKEEEGAEPTHMRDWNATRGEYDWFNPIEGREDLLDAFQQGPDYQFLANHHEAKRTHPMGSPDSPEEEKQAAGMRAVDADPDVQLFRSRHPSDHLSSHVLNHLLEAYQREGKVPRLADALQQVADGTVRSLVREAAEQLDLVRPAANPGRGGDATPPDRPGYAYLGGQQLLEEGYSRGKLRMEGVEWDTLDMHDALPLTGHHSLPDWLGTDQPIERKQCVLLSAVAAALWAKGGQPPEKEVVWAEEREEEKAKLFGRQL